MPVYLGDKKVGVYRVVKETTPAPTPSSDKFGFTLDMFIGEAAGVEGYLQRPVLTGTTLNISGFTHADTDDVLAYKFCYLMNESPEEVHFLNLETAEGAYAMSNMFLNCYGLKKAYFHTLYSGANNCLRDCFKGCSNMTELHFKTGTEDWVNSLYGANNKFGATNATVYFDL